MIGENISILRRWVDRGYIIQIDAGSIRGHFGDKTKKIAIEMIKRGYVHLIGSDAHDNKGRNFCLKKTYDFLEETWNSSLVDALKKNSVKLLNGDKLEKIENSKKNDKGKEENFINRLINFFKV